MDDIVKSKQEVETAGDFNYWLKAAEFGYSNAQVFVGFCYLLDEYGFSKNDTIGFE